MTILLSTIIFLGLLAFGGWALWLIRGYCEKCGTELVANYAHLKLAMEEATKKQRGLQ